VATTSSTAQQFKRVLADVTNTPKSDRVKVPPAPKRIRTRRQLPTQPQLAEGPLAGASVIFDPPANGTMYTIREAIPQLVSIQAHKKRAEQWRYLLQTKLVPDINEHQLRRMLADCRSGSLDLDRHWLEGSGRRPVMDIPTLKAYADDRLQILAKSLDKSDIIKMSRLPERSKSKNLAECLCP
jgi:hypothetical protein